MFFYRTDRTSGRCDYRNLQQIPQENLAEMMQIGIGFRVIVGENRDISESLAST